MELQILFAASAYFVTAQQKLQRSESKRQGARKPFSDEEVILLTAIDYPVVETRLRRRAFLSLATR